MNRSTSKNRIVRVLAGGLGLAIAGGISLVAVAPAQAAEYVTNIDPSTIGAGAEVNGGWYVLEGSANPAFTANPAGLELHGLSGIGQQLVGTLNNATVDAYVQSGDLSWTTTSGSAANLQIMVNARSSGESGTIILTSVGSTPGENIIDLGSTWTTSGPITLDDADSTLDFAEGDTASLSDFLYADGFEGVTGFGLVGAAGQNPIVTAASWPYSDGYSVWVNNYSFLRPLDVAGVTVEVAGKATVGQTLTATTAGWPEGAEVSYQWASGQLYNGGPIEGATGTTYKITEDEVHRFISVTVTGTLEGFAETTVFSDRTALVPALEKPTALAPVADSSKIADFLSEKGVEKQAQTTIGLPKGKLDGSKTYAANITWTGLDSFVDVYLYSTPTKVGTFPVIDGEAQISLSAEVMSSLEGGSHTLVVTGQTSGEVQAVAIEIAPAIVVDTARVEGPALADTGSSVTVPLAAAVFLLLAGAGLVVARRRMAH